jgi:hypothetical protein
MTGKHIVHALQVKGMPGVVGKVEVGAGDVGGGFFTQPARSKGITPSRDDERGCFWCTPILSASA